MPSPPPKRSRAARRAPFDLALLPVRGQHADLELRCGGLRHRVDSYYLALDGVTSPGDEGRSKVRRVLAKMLRAARVAIARAKGADVVLFPYDFSDQYTGLLRFALVPGDRVAVTRVFSSLEGWSIHPSTAWRLDATAWRDPAPWPTDGPPLVIDRATLLAALERAEQTATRHVRRSKNAPPRGGGSAGAIARAAIRRTR